MCVLVVVAGALGTAGCFRSAPSPEEEMFKRSRKAIAADGLVTTLMPGPTPTSIVLRVENPTTATKTFCDYHTPFEGLRNDIFEVTGKDGVALDYRGMMAKRAPPRDDDFLDVAPGTFLVSRSVELSEGYALSSGTWQVRFAGNGVSGLPASTTITLTVP